MATMAEEIEVLRQLAFELAIHWVEQESPTCRFKLQAMSCLGDAIASLDACLVNLSNSVE